MSAAERRAAGDAAGGGEGGFAVPPSPRAGSAGRASKVAEGGAALTDDVGRGSAFAVPGGCGAAVVVATFSHAPTPSRAARAITGRGFTGEAYHTALSRGAAGALTWPAGRRPKRRHRRHRNDEVVYPRHGSRK